VLAVKTIDTCSLVPLVFASDESYAMPLTTALRSVVETKRTPEPLEIYILYDRFDLRIQTMVGKSLPVDSALLHWVPVDLTRFAAYSTSSYISVLTYARLLIAELLPPSIRKVLYLDVDILVCDDLTPLLQTDLEGIAIGAVPDRLDKRLKAGETIWTQDLPRVQDYFNAGVLLMDLERWRAEQISEKALDYLKEHPKTPLSDQDALNVVCDGRWKQLNARWNVINDHRTKISNRGTGNGPAILHFAGPLKPWQVGVLDPNARIYDEIRNRTLFARSKRERTRDAVQAPLRFYNSGLLWQLRRFLRRFEPLRRAVLAYRNVAST
jgi:lipopolysaccharide biosynthesis glycosyltransferase